MLLRWLNNRGVSFAVQSCQGLLPEHRLACGKSHQAELDKAQLGVEVAGALPGTSLVVLGTYGTARAPAPPHTVAAVPDCFVPKVFPHCLVIGWLAFFETN